MSSAGDEVLGVWREAGAWWAGEAPLEVRRVRRASGRIQEEVRKLPIPWAEHAESEYTENHTEEIALRPRKTRDEKVAKACGYAPPTPGVLTAASSSDPYVPLHLLSGYSFGQSLLFAEELPRRAAQFGLPAAALVDRFALTGVIEFAREAKKQGIKPLIGASLEVPEGGEIVLIARSARGYRELSLLITACHLEEPRLYPLATWERLARHRQGLLCLTGGDRGPLNRLLAARDYESARELAQRLIDLYGRTSVWMEIDRAYLPWESDVNRRALELAESLGIRPVAGGAVTHPRPADFPAQDILACAESLCLVDELIGRKPPRTEDQPPVVARPTRSLNAERFFRSAAEMRSLYADRPDLLDATHQIAAACEDDVLPIRTRLPVLSGDDPESKFRTAVAQGFRERYPRPTAAQKRRIEMETQRILALGFSHHFVLIHEVCNWARDQKILFSGRGSVVDSVVAYCLGLSRIDAFRHNLLFDRFLPADGSKRPDIDIDFEAHRRDDVRQHIIQTFGQEHVATVAAIGAMNVRGIVREVGKALGLPNELIGFLAKRIHGGVSPESLEGAMERRPELQQSGIPKERFRWVFRLAQMLADVPRNMRAHSSGVIVSADPIAWTVPVQATAYDQSGPLHIIQWDKRSAKYYFDKFDILCLRGQDVLSGTQTRLQSLDVEDIPLDDPETYRAMRSGELIGIPQSASPAMRQAHIRLRTENLEDASLVQAGIRPGVGGAVKINELIARRRGKPFAYEHPELENILGHTYGIVVFQEQIDMLLQTFCRYGAGEAEEIREQIHKRRREDYGQVIREEMISRMIHNGFERKVAEHVFELVAGFKGYGFAQGHALAFAEISIRSIYCQQNFPAHYFASLLSAQPAGYYGPATLANEARNRGILMLPLDVNRSEELFIVEDVKATRDPKIILPSGGIRIGWMQVSGLSGATRARIVAQRERPYESFIDFVRRVRPSRDELEQLVLAGAFDRLQPHRRALLWAIPQALAEAQPGEKLDMTPEVDETNLTDFNPVEKAIHERLVMGLDVDKHLMAFERERIATKQGLTTAEVRALPAGRRAIVVGNPIRLRFPPTPSGKRVVFFDLEDETGLLNVTCFDAVYRRDGQAIVCSPYVTLIGQTQWRDGHTAFLASRVFPYQPVRTWEHLQTADLPIKVADFLVG